MPRHFSQLRMCWHWYIPTSSISLKTSMLFEENLFLERFTSLLWSCNVLWAIWVTFPPTCWASTRLFLLLPVPPTFSPCTHPWPEGALHLYKVLDPAPMSDHAAACKVTHALLDQGFYLICLPVSLIMIYIQRLINRATHDLPTLGKWEQNCCVSVTFA